MPLLIFGIPKESSCREMRTLIVENKALFNVELANERSTREQGLMFRESLAECHGMWFDFVDTKLVSMWMKNTAMSLDIVFVNEALVVEHVIESTVPYSLALLRSEVPVRYALELISGSINLYNINIGDRVILGKERGNDRDNDYKYSEGAICAQLKTN